MGDKEKNPNRVEAGKRIQQKRREELEGLKEELREYKNRTIRDELSEPEPKPEESPNNFIFIVGISVVVLVGIGFYMRKDIDDYLSKPSPNTPPPPPPPPPKSKQQIIKDF